MDYDVVRVKVVKPFVLEVEFEDGAVRMVDLEPHLWGPIMEPLRDAEYFASVAVDRDAGTVVWPNGADFSPEFLYNEGKVAARVDG